MDSVEKQKGKLQKLARSGDKKATATLELIARLEPHLSDGKYAVTLEMSAEEKALAKPLFLLTNKPTIYACNVAEGDLANPEANPFVGQVRAYVATHHDTSAVVVSAEIESELVMLAADEAAEYLKDLGVTESGAGNLIREAYHLLGLRTYLTTGVKETRAWTIQAGWKAPQAAGVIHSDFEKSFISAETITFEDLVAFGSTAKAREVGKLRTEGKEYVVQDGDVMEFKTFV